MVANWGFQGWNRITNWNLLGYLLCYAKVLLYF
nr:MAG TPA: hypothetical protein [Caudoviricetes sp.]